MLILCLRRLYQDQISHTYYDSNEKFICASCFRLSVWCIFRKCHLIVRIFDKREINRIVMPMAKAQSDGICLRCESNRFKVNEIRFISN